MSQPTSLTKNHVATWLDIYELTCYKMFFVLLTLTYMSINPSQSMIYRQLKHENMDKRIRQVIRRILMLRLHEIPLNKWSSQVPKTYDL